MIYIKKRIKINQYETGEYTIEEILEKYTSYVNKKSSEFLAYLKNHGNHSLHVDIEDLKQIANIGIIKAYNNYSIEFKNEEYKNDKTDIGFFPYMQKTVLSQLQVACRNILKTNSENYKIHEIQVSSIYEQISNDVNNDLELVDIIESHYKDEFEEYENATLLNELLSILSEKERVIIEDYYFNNKNQIVLANELKISRSYVSSIINKALKKMKKYNDKQLILEERGMQMFRTKTFEFNALIDFLTNGVKEYSTLEDAINAFISEKLKENIRITKEDIYLSLNKRKASYLEVKKMYDNRQALEETIVPKAINSKVNEEKEIIEPKPIEEKPVSKSINLDVLKEVNIVNLTADVNDIRVEFTPKGMNLYNINLKELTVKDLEKLQANIQKVIEINNTIYK